MDDHPIISCTVRCKTTGFDSDLSLYTIEDDVYKEPFKKALGFCLNYYCKKGTPQYYLNSGFSKAKRNHYVTKDHKEEVCPYCSHSLFWTIKWKYSQ